MKGTQPGPAPVPIVPTHPVHARGLACGACTRSLSFTTRQPGSVAGPADRCVATDSNGAFEVTLAAIRAAANSKGLRPATPHFRPYSLTHNALMEDIGLLFVLLSLILAISSYTYAYTWQQLAVLLRQFGVQAVPAIERLMESITVVAEEPQTFPTNVEAEPMVDQSTWMARVVSCVETRGGRNSR